MSKVFERAELNDAIDAAMQYGDTVLMERCINGAEFTVAVLQGEALPISIRIATPRVFYDYRAKYESDRTEYICPGTSKRRRGATVRGPRGCLLSMNWAAPAGAASIS